MAKNGKFGPAGFGGGMGNMGNMIKQAQKMQEDMTKLKAELDERVLETTAGGGAVTVTVNGKKEILSIKIKPDVVDPEDVEMLEDLITASVNEAIRQMDELVASEMGKVTGGMSLPF